MGKNTDKLYVTQSEHAESKGASSKEPARVDSTLPFWSCGISQQPIGEGSGVVDKSGHVFDITNLFPYVNRHKVNPVTYEPMDIKKDTRKLIIAKDGDGQYADPVTMKQFLRKSDAVVIWPTGNVFHMETIRENNIKSKHWRDLVTDEDFTRDDVIRLIGGAGVGMAAAKKSKPEPEKEQRSKNSDPQNAYNTPMGITSTVAPELSKKVEESSSDDKIIKQLKPKRFDIGYASIETTVGRLNVELNTKYSPKAVYNFVRLAQRGYYDGVLFHRNIKHFMVQTGDPTGTGRGGESAYEGGKPFADETNTPLKHDSRGILAMANKGKNTNTSQFFITYRRAPHLDGKHTVFGKVVGGLDVLDKLELVDTDPENDKPRAAVKMESVKIIVDPFDEPEEEIASGKNGGEESESSEPFFKRSGDDENNAEKFGPVGKYLKRANLKVGAPQEMQQQKKRKTTTLAKSDFSGW